MWKLVFLVCTFLMGNQLKPVLPQTFFIFYKENVFTTLSPSLLDLQYMIVLCCPTLMLFPANGSIFVKEKANTLVFSN